MRPDHHAERGSVLEAKSQRNTMSSEFTGINGKIRHWKTCLSAIVDDRHKMVNVSFKHAPPAYGFVDYFVSLNNADTKRKIVRIRTNTTSVTFTDLEKGKYVIVVYPIDYKGRCGDYCSRYKTDIFSIGKNTNNLLNLTVCGNNTRTQTTINRPLEHTTTTTPNVNISKLYLLFIPLLFVIMAFVIYKWKRRLITADDLNITSFATNTPTFTGKVKIFVIYAEDHLFHTEACRSFIHYLNEHCFCDVLNTFPEYDSVPAYDMEKYSDIVLVINSQAFYNEFCAWKCRETHSTIKSYFCEEIFEKILQNVKQSPTPGSCEYLMCAMDYTDNEYLPLEFGRCELFKITYDMTALVCYIQNLDLLSTNESDIPCISEHIYSSSDGNSLISAIENAEYFEKTHPNWFQEKYMSVSYNKIIPGIHGCSLVVNKSSGREVILDCI